MRKDVDDPRREFVLTALSLGLFAGVNLAGLFQAPHQYASRAWFGRQDGS